MAVQARTARGAEDELPVRVGRLNGAQLLCEARRERDVALAVAALGLADAAVGDLPAQLHVGPVGKDHVAPPAQLACLADAQPGVGEELEEQTPPRGKLADQAPAFAANVKKHRERLGIDQEEFARRIGFHRAYMGHVEQARYNLSLYKASKIAHGLGTTIDELLRDDQP